MDSASTSGLDKPAEITFANVTYANPKRAANGSTVCPSSVCTQVSFSGTTYVMNVTSWSSYSLNQSESICTLGLLNTTCYVSDAQPVNNTNYINATGPIIIQSGGSLYNSTAAIAFVLNSTQYVLIESGGSINLTVTPSGTNAGNATIYGTNNITVNGIIRAIGAANGNGGAINLTAGSSGNTPPACTGITSTSVATLAGLLGETATRIGKVETPIITPDYSVLNQKAQI